MPQANDDVISNLQGILAKQNERMEILEDLHDAREALEAQRTMLQIVRNADHDKLMILKYPGDDIEERLKGLVERQDALKQAAIERLGWKDFSIEPEEELLAQIQGDCTAEGRLDAKDVKRYIGRSRKLLETVFAGVQAQEGRIADLRDALRKAKEG